MVYLTRWINACIILHFFCIDQKLELQKNFLQDRHEWENIQCYLYGPFKFVEEKFDSLRKKI